MLKKCTCAIEPDVMDKVGPDEDQFSAGCWTCRVPETMVACDTEKEAIEYFEQEIREQCQLVLLLNDRNKQGKVIAATKLVSHPL